MKSRFKETPPDGFTHWGYKITRYTWTTKRGRVILFLNFGGIITTTKTLSGAMNKVPNGPRAKSPTVICGKQMQTNFGWHTALSPTLKYLTV